MDLNQLTHFRWIHSACPCPCRDQSKLNRRQRNAKDSKLSHDFAGKSVGNSKVWKGMESGGRLISNGWSVGLGSALALVFDLCVGHPLALSVDCGLGFFCLAELLFVLFCFRLWMTRPTDSASWLCLLSLPTLCPATVWAFGPIVYCLAAYLRRQIDFEACK